MRFSVLLLGVLLTFRSPGFECPRLPVVPPSGAPVRYTESLLWEVTGPEEQRNFLFGTIHLAAEMTGQPTPAVTSALMASTQFGMEVIMDLETLMEIGERMRYPDRKTLRAVLGDELFMRAITLLSGYGISESDAAQLKPWAVFTTLSLPPGTRSAPLDMVLMSTAQRTRKTIFGLETLAEQTTIFESIEMQHQVTLVAETVCHYEVLNQITADLIDDYRRRDLRAVYRHAERFQSPAQDLLTEELLVARNLRLAQRMQRHLAAGGAFIAIGALHLPGTEGVLAHLVAHGYRVRAVAD